MAPNSIKRRKNTFHLDGELPQLLLQLCFNGAHVLRRAQETSVRATFLSKHRMFSQQWTTTAQMRGIYLFAVSYAYVANRHKIFNLSLSKPSSVPAI